MANYSISTERQ